MSPARPHCLAMVTSAWPLGALPNGIVFYTARLTEAFRELGVKPVVMTWQLEAGNSSPDIIDMPSCRCSEGRLNHLAREIARRIAPALARSNRECILRDSFDHLLAHHPVEILQMEEAFGLPVGLIRQRRIPIVVRLHGPWFLNGEVSGAEKNAEFHRRVAAEGRAIALADAVTAPSYDVLDQTRDYYRLSLDSAVVIPNPIDPREGGEAWSLESASRDTILFVGRFDLHKGADVLIAAFAKLAASRPRLQLDFVGPDRGMPMPGNRTIKLREYLAEHVADVSIRNRICIHGAKSPDEIRELRRRALVTVVPSRYETFGNTALEALAAGCPVVASDIGGLREIIRNNETGLLADPKQPESLACELARLLDDAEYAARLGKQAREDVATRFHPLTIAAQTLDYYAEVLARWKSGRSRT